MKGKKKNSFTITDHARQRLIERYKIPSKNVYNVVKLARASNMAIKPEKAKDFKQYVNFLYSRSNFFGKCVRFKFHNKFVFVFNGNLKTLITVFPIPESFYHCIKEPKDNMPEKAA